MSLLTVEEMRDHIETDMVDDALERVIDAADAEIIRKLGPVDSQPENLPGGGRFLFLARRASAIASISERFDDGFGYQTVALAANDYSLLADGMRVERLATGTNPASAWRGEAIITSTPADTTAERTALLVKIVRLELGYTGHLVVSAGDVRVQSIENFHDAKAALFRPFATAGRRLIL